MIIRKYSFFVAITILFAGFLSGCDSPPGPKDPTQSPSHLQNARVEPDSISFSHISTLYDTTVTLHLQATITNLSASSEPSYVIRSSTDSIITRGSLQPGDTSNVFTAQTDLNLTTATFATYYTYIYASEPQPDGSWIQSKVNIYGLSGSPPEILAVNNPDTVYKPSGDSVRNVPFQAKVTDEDGQDNIETVAFELIRDDNTLDVIELSDDGSSDSGDPTAGDSVYTQILSVDAGNEAATYNIHYYAVDKAELVSDTVKTTFTISN